MSSLILVGAMIASGFVAPRTDCNAMRGTPYREPVAQIERDFYLNHCLYTNSAILEAIKQCESHGDYQAINPNGHYGAYQFDIQTWESVGGTGNPIDAPPAEQDYRAQLLLEQRGTQPWSCKP